MAQIKQSYCKYQMIFVKLCIEKLKFLLSQLAGTPKYIIKPINSIKPMSTNHNYLFVYGTLLKADNEFGHYLCDHSTYVKKGQFKGLLYDIGDFPGAVPHPDGESYVHGSIYEYFTDEVLWVLDEYEGLAPGEVHPQEYTRKLVDIETEDGKMNCWIYLYNWPVAQYYAIPSGDYLKHKQSQLNEVLTSRVFKGMQPKKKKARVLA
ncbi:MAG: gamma-glutamylcyclotransferase [Sphingobacteriaceae bacterium]|nr:MAG: gamma-glutamylcyclotransferase [Sphingobacteriaceae bacterium]